MGTRVRTLFLVPSDVKHGGLIRLGSVIPFTDLKQLRTKMKTKPIELDIRLFENKRITLFVQATKFLRERIARPEIRSYLQGLEQGKKLYMVTGIQYNAQLSPGNAEAQNSETALAFQLQEIILQTPIELGTGHPLTPPLSQTPALDVRDISAAVFGLEVDIKVDAKYDSEVYHTIDKFGRGATMGYSKPGALVTYQYATFDFSRLFRSDDPTLEWFWDEYDIRDMVAPQFSQQQCQSYYYGLSKALQLICTSNSSTVPENRLKSPSDAGFYAKKHLYPVKESHAVVKVWPNLLARILQEFVDNDDSRTNPYFESIHCMGLGYEHTASRDIPVVILAVAQPEAAVATAAKASFASAKSFMRARSFTAKGKKMCSEFGLPDLGVEVAVTSRSSQASQTNSSIISKDVDDEAGVWHLTGPFDKKLFLGASIRNPSEDGISGTFGAYLSATDQKGRTELLALTCEHVVFPKEISCDETKGTTGLRFSKSLLRENDRPKYPMVTPSPSDYTQTKAVFHKDQERTQRTLELCMKNKEDELTIAFHQEAKLLGYMYGTGGSDRKSISNFPMDWAVIAANDDDISKTCLKELNMLPPIEFVYQPKALGRITNVLEKNNLPALELAFGKPGTGRLPPQISCIREEPLSPKEVYYKVGRSSYWTAGRYNPCISWRCRAIPHAHSHIEKDLSTPSGSRESEDMNVYADSEWGQSTKRGTHEIAKYMGCYVECFLGVLERYPFSHEGDSGSLVLDGNGKAVGLVIAGRGGEGSVPDITAVVPLKEIFEDMKELGLKDIKFANA